MIHEPHCKTEHARRIWPVQLHDWLDIHLCHSLKHQSSLTQTGQPFSDSKAAGLIRTYRQHMYDLPWLA